MQRKLWWIGILLGVAVLLRSPVVGAVESDPLPVPKGTPRERAVSAYNEGVKLMRDKHYAAAQEKFEQALTLDEALAEAGVVQRAKGPRFSLNLISPGIVGHLQISIDHVVPSMQRVRSLHRPACRCPRARLCWR